MKKLLLMSLLFLFGTATFAQSQQVLLKFVGQGTDGTRIQMEYVEVKNLTGDSTLWGDNLLLEWPDTVLTMTVDTTSTDTTVSIHDYALNEEFFFSHTGPNPFNSKTEVALQLPESGNVLLQVYDLAGKLVSNFEGNLPNGIHRFQIRVAQAQTYVVTAQCGAMRASTKIVNAGRGSSNGISYIGGDFGSNVQSKMEIQNAYHYGDTLMCSGYVHFNDSLYCSDTVLVLMDSMQDSLQTVVLTFHVARPSVVTNRPDYVRDNGALLGGTVDDGGIAPSEVGLLIAKHPNVSVEDTWISLWDTLGHPLCDSLGDFQVVMDTLQPNTPYFVRAYAITVLDTCYGEEYVFMTLSQLRDNQPCTVAAVTDANGNTYSTVRIGRQCWTRENLRTTRYNDTLNITNVADLVDTYIYYTDTAYLFSGIDTLQTDTIHYSIDTLQTDTIHYSDYSATVPYCYYPDSNATAAETYGLLYNYMAASIEGERSFAEPSGIRGICPTGWHIPAVGEWEQLSNYLESQRVYHAGDISTNIAKSLAAQENWLEDTVYTYSIGNNPTNNNATGFSALPAGSYADSTGAFARFWSCSGEQPNSISVLRLDYNLPGITTDMLAPDSVASVRCVRDVEEVADGFACPGMPTVTDVEGNVYNTVMVGNQCWMKENLRTEHYADNTPLMQGVELSVSTPYFYLPSVETEEQELYGVLYNWTAAVRGGQQGICPTGWHVPTSAEWMELHRYVRSIDEYRCGGSSANSIGKALAGNYGWRPSSDSCDTGDATTVHNATGFSALPAGRYPNNAIGINATFWTSTERSESQAVTRYLTYSTPNFSEGNMNKDYAASVRCVKD